VQVDQALIDWRSNHQGVVAASDILLEHTGPGGSSALSADSIAAVLAPISWAWTIDLSDVTFSAFESSGQLGVLRNEELLVALASWRSTMADLQGDERVAEESVYRDLVPFLNRHASWVTIEFSDQGLVAEGMAPRRPSKFQSGLPALLSSREFENLIRGRRTASAGAVLVYDTARIRLERIRTLIGQELVR